MNLKSQPTDGKFGTFGGKYIPETLMPVVDELEEKYNDIKYSMQQPNFLESGYVFYMFHLFAYSY